MKNIVYQVTWKNMKMNRKRTWTTFLGIFFMILLMTCVFVGRNTAVGYLQEVGSQKKGKWHVSMYDISEKELGKVRSLDYIKETAKSADYGYTDFAESGNKMRPYFYVKSYENTCFDWMNLKLKEGRLPENGSEVVISQSAIDDGAAIALGDIITAKYFDRTITGIAEDVSTTFPFQKLNITYGETKDLPQDFPFYEENDSFRIDKKYTGEETELKVVGILETPWFEQGGSAGYSAFTCFDENKSNTFNLSLLLDLKKIPDSASMYRELEEAAGNRKLDFNNDVLAYSGDSSDSVVNFIVMFMSAFFILMIIAAAVILIYNVFNISFEERSRYLGMLCSVGATGKQKRSSVYFEAFSLFLPAFPLGILAGCFVVWIGMSLFQPFIYKMMRVSTEVYGKVPIHLLVSYKEIGLITVVSVLTVFLSAVLPARKISKIGPIECIRGSANQENGKTNKNLKYKQGLTAEKLLARNSLRHQKRKTKGIKRAAATYMVILIITVSGAQMITKLISYRMLDGSTVQTNNDGWDYQLVMMNGSVRENEEFEKLKKEIRSDSAVEDVSEQYLGMFVGDVPWESLSEEYWTDVHKVFNLYYHRELSEEEFKKQFENGPRVMNIIAVEGGVFEKIAKETDTDMELLNKSDTPCAIVVQSGEVSTENWRVGGMEPEKFAFYEVEKMTDLKKGEELPMSVYSEAQDAEIDFPLCIAGFASNEQLKDYFTFHTETMWVIVDLETGEKINDILIDHENPEESHYTMDHTLYLKLNGEAADLIQRLDSLSEPDDSNYIFIPAKYEKDLADAIIGIIQILLWGFVLLTSVICLLNLYNAIHGWISEQKHHFAMMVSIGMTQKQIEKMLLYEAGYLLVSSSIRAVVISAPVIIFLKKCLIGRFGYVRMAFPWWIFAAAILIAAIVIFAFMLYHYRREKNYEFRAVLMV